jgi:hypothetical protein
MEDVLNSYLIGIQGGLTGFSAWLSLPCMLIRGNVSSGTFSGIITSLQTFPFIANKEGKLFHSGGREVIFLLNIQGTGSSSIQDIIFFPELSTLLKKRDKIFLGVVEYKR